MKMKTVLGLALALIASFAIACDSSETNVIQNPTDPNALVSVTALGQCSPLSAGFQCCDESECRKESAVVACSGVTWDTKNQTTNIDVGSKSGTPGGCIQVNGLEPGPYSVEQTVTGPDGNVKGQKQHNPVVK